MKKLLSTLTILIFWVTLGHAQVFEGTIKDAKTNAPLPYVNVGLIGKGIGTVTDADGHYKITFSSDNDDLKLSMVGYEAQVFKVGDFKAKSANKVIALQPA